MTTTSAKNNFLPPGLVSNLQDVLANRKGNQDPPHSRQTPDDEISSDGAGGAGAENAQDQPSKPVVLVTNGEGIDSPGLTKLVEGLVAQGTCHVHVCAPHSDRSVSSHSLTPSETIEVSSVEMSGATAYDVYGTPADCISLALSGALFSWSKPALVISGINRGTSCGFQMFYSGTIAGAREALFRDVPSLSLSLNWKKEVSRESDFKDAVDVCLPLIQAAIKDIEGGVFPKGCSFNIEIPTSPSTNKGFKITRKSLWKADQSWRAVSANRHPSGGHFMSNQQSLGIQLAQLSRDASAAGAARRLNTQKPNVEVDSVGVAGKTDQRVKKYFRLEFEEKEPKDMEEDLDFRALENGYVAITPMCFSSNDESETQTSASNWITTALSKDD